VLTEERTMATPILVGYDTRAADRAPVEFGAAAAAFTGAPLIVAAVYGSAATLGSYGHGLAEDLAGDEAGGALERLKRELSERGIDVEMRSLPGVSAPRALHNAAEEFGAGLLVLGSTERGRAGRLLLGSTADRLMHGAPCPIAVVPRGWEAGGGMRTIGVAYVESAEGREALAGAVALARRAGAKLRVLSAAKAHGFGETYGGGSALVPATTYEEVGSALRVSVEQAVQHATEGVTGVAVEPDVSVGDPADFLIAASERLDLLVCGSRGYGPARAVLLGGVSRRVTAEAHCPVIVLARGTEAGIDALIDEQAGAIG
jgi:nucleotide-binding universal stress UspA family protein